MCKYVRQCVYLGRRQIPLRLNEHEDFRTDREIRCEGTELILFAAFEQAIRLNPFKQARVSCRPNGLLT